jgi:hypothetical protein
MLIGEGSMIRRLLPLVLLTGLVSTASGDGLILGDGRRLAGHVTEKPDGIEITIEGQTLHFSKDDVKHWIKSPLELTGDAKKLVAEAKEIFQAALGIQDESQAEAKFREALPKVQKAREAYVEARNFFPDGYADLDRDLVDIMKLTRLLRDRMHSQLVSAPPVKVKDAPPPPKANPSPAEVKPPPLPEPPPPATFVLKDAFEILADPSRRADTTLRGQARAILKKASEENSPLADVAVAGYLFLSRDDVDWQLRAKANPAQKSEALVALQEFFKGVGIDKIEALSDKELGDAVAFLSLKVKSLRGKAPEASLDALSLFVAGLASSLITRGGGNPSPALSAAFKDVGYEKSEFGTVWGRREGLAMDDYRKWLASGEYSLAVVQFQNDYRSVSEFTVHYAEALLMVFEAIADKRSYTKAASYFDILSRSAPSAAAQAHCAAFAKTIREESPCAACAGTHKVNCNVCKGKTKVNLECTKCGGSGKINLRGLMTCPGCKGQGRFNNVDCPKCKATGKLECKARGCTREVKPPTFESFADAFPCPVCKGKGTMMLHVACPCPECGGIGMTLAPKIDPTKMLR